MNHSVIPFPMKKKEEITSVAKVPSYVRKLAASLLWTLQIPEGLALIHIVGHGDEYSNQRAIESWLLAHYTEEEIGSMTQPLSTVEATLVSYINKNHWEALSC